MKNIKRFALKFCVLTLVVVCGLVFSTEVTWTKYDFRSRFSGYRCIPNETRFRANGIDDPVTCGKKFYLTNKGLSFFYQPDNRQCIGCRVYFYGPVWTHRYEKLPGSVHFSRDLMTNCKDILENDPTAASGLYEITVGDTPGTFYCDMTTDGGGWTVFQNRFDGSVDFERNFSDYENGFGDMNGEFWLGLRYIQILADKFRSELKLVFTNIDGVTAYEQYQEFRLLDGTNYTLSVGGLSTNFTGINEHSENFFNYTNGAPFSTFDREKDSSVNYRCASFFGGGWWFADCTAMCFNCENCLPHCKQREELGFYHYGFDMMQQGTTLKSSRMMLRPI